MRASSSARSISIRRAASALSRSRRSRERSLATFGLIGSTCSRTACLGVMTSTSTSRRCRGRGDLGTIVSMRGGRSDLVRAGNSTIIGLGVGGGVSICGGFMKIGGRIGCCCIT